MPLTIRKAGPAQATVAMKAEVDDPTLSLRGTAAQLIERYPPRPVPTTWAATSARREQVAARLLAPPFTLENAHSQNGRRFGLAAALTWLQGQPGDTWQERWI